MLLHPPLLNPLLSPLDPVVVHITTPSSSLRGSALWSLGGRNRSGSYDPSWRCQNTSHAWTRPPRVTIYGDLRHTRPCVQRRGDEESLRGHPTACGLDHHRRFCLLWGIRAGCVGATQWEVLNIALFWKWKGRRKFEICPLSCMTD